MISKNTVNIVDCDADPFVPESLELIEHHKHGMFECDFSNIELADWNEPGRHSVFGTKNGYITGADMREKFVEKSLNANVLDFLLKNPNLIPRDLIGCTVYFWGTLFCWKDSGRGPIVRGFGWSDCYREPQGPHWGFRIWDINTSPYVSIYPSWWPGFKTSTLAALRKEI